MHLNKRKSSFAALWLTILTANGCTPAGVDDPGRFDQMEQANITVRDQVVSAWIAKTDNERARGFMEVEAELLETGADGRHPGMLFVFTTDQPPTHGFWMRRVPVPLDIAFVDSDRSIVTIKTMAPFDDRTTHSDRSYRYALEVRAGLFKDLGISEGDTLDFPDSVLNNVR